MPAPAAPTIPPSSLGIVSLVLAGLGTALSALAWTLVMDTDLDGLTFFAILYVPVLVHVCGFCVGLVGIFRQRNRTRWMAYVGAPLNLFLAVYQLGAPWS